MTQPSPMAEVKRLLQRRMGELVRVLAPEGALKGGYWMAKNPARDDRRPGSFWIVVDRAGFTPGAWRDEATGQKGDVFDLISMVHTFTKAEALAWAKAWVSYEPLPPAKRRAAALQAEDDRRRREKDAALAAAASARKAFGVYVAAKKRPFLASPADVYLKGRRIDVEALPRVPGALGWLPDMMHAEAKTAWPVLVAGFSDDHGHIKAVHRTFLAADGRGKAPVDPVRKIWPQFKGLAIRLWRGDSGMSVAECVKHGVVDTLCLCEGVEDGLSIALARPDLRVWAAGSLGNLAHITLPACCEAVIVAADNDWGKPQAEAALVRALAALAAQGRPVRVARSPVGKDFNDCLQSEHVT